MTFFGLLLAIVKQSAERNLEFSLGMILGIYFPVYKLGNGSTEDENNSNGYSHTETVQLKSHEMPGPDTNSIFSVCLL